MRRKRADTARRIEGELPEAPAKQESIPDWWNEAAAVLDRVRSETNSSISGVTADQKNIRGEQDSLAQEQKQIQKNLEERTTPESIRSLLESNSDTNILTDELMQKLVLSSEFTGFAAALRGGLMGLEEEQVMDNKTLDGGEF